MKDKIQAQLDQLDKQIDWHEENLKLQLEQAQLNHDNQMASINEQKCILSMAMCSPEEFKSIDEIKLTK